MKNFRRSRTTIEESLRQAETGLHQEKRTFLQYHQETFRFCFSEYDRHALNGTLHALRSIWENAVGDSPHERQEKDHNRGLAKSIYGSHRPFVNKHWEEIRTQNGSKTLICPICGLNECKDMDHYIPLSIMQEYSFHLTNLIPLCHSCNHKKLDKWLDNAGRREIFNAYFDEMFPDPIIECFIRFSELDHQPEICVDQNPALRAENPSHRITISTLCKLHLIDEYRSIIRRDFGDELVKIHCYFEQQSNRKNNLEIWGERKNLYHLTLAHADRLTFPTICIYTAIVNSEVMDEWASKINLE